MKKILNDIYNVRIPLIIIIIYLILTNIFFSSVCPSVILFNIECPACGLTRACLYLLTFQFSKSFSLNPSAPLWIILIILAFISRYIKKIPITILYVSLIITCLATIIIYIFKII